jgi:integrase
VARGPRRNRFFAGRGNFLELLGSPSRPCSPTTSLPPLFLLRDRCRRRTGELWSFTLTGQRREEVAQLKWDEVDEKTRSWSIPGSRTKNKKAHIVHLSELAWKVIQRCPTSGPYVFGTSRGKNFQTFGELKRALDKRCGVTGWRLHDFRRTIVFGMARLGVPPHVADKILNHQAGTISGVAAVYQRHDLR